LGGIAANWRNGERIVTSGQEHASVVEPLEHLRGQGYEIISVHPREDGHFSADDFIDAVDENTVMVCCMFVNNETGAILPVSQIIKGVRKKNKKTLIHIDAVQGFGKLPLKISTVDADFISMSGHKIYAPKGIGALYIKKGTKFKPLLFGGGQQLGQRVGTESVPLIAGFSAAVSMCMENMSRYTAHYAELYEYLKSKLLEIPDVSINSPDDGVKYILNLSVKGIRSEIMLHFLEQEEIYVSSGSACSKGARSHVLSSLGLSEQRIDTAIRISFCYETTQNDLDVFVARLKQGIDSLIKTK
jgi:cysteine desulfurase